MASLVENMANCIISHDRVTSPLDQNYFQLIVTSKFILYCNMCLISWLVSFMGYLF